MTPRNWIYTVVSVLLLVSLVVFAGVLWSLHIARSQGFYQTMPDLTLRVQESAFEKHNTPCDILIYGDSTALTGVDPGILHNETGLSACNIASTRPIVDILGTMPVDQFLQNNPKPKILILQLGPEAFFRSNEWDASAMAPLVILIRRHPGFATDRIMLTHPSLTLQSAEAFLHFHYLYSRRNLDRFNTLYGPTFDQYQKNGGILHYIKDPQTTCVLPKTKLKGPLDRSWVESVRARYQAMGITTLIRASPVPGCDPRLDEYRSALAPIVDVNVESMEPSNFNDGDRHMTVNGARLSTEQLIPIIRAHLAAANSATRNTATP